MSAIRPCAPFLNERIGDFASIQSHSRQKRVRRSQPNAWLIGVERCEGTGRLGCRRPLQLQVRRAMKERQCRFDAWHDQRTLTDLQWRSRTANGGSTSIADEEESVYSS